MSVETEDTAPAGLEALGALRETVGLAPDHPLGGQKPVMHALIGVRARAHDRQAGRGLG